MGRFRAIISLLMTILKSALASCTKIKTFMCLLRAYPQIILPQASAMPSSFNLVRIEKFVKENFSVSKV